MLLFVTEITMQNVNHVLTKFCFDIPFLVTRTEI